MALAAIHSEASHKGGQHDLHYAIALALDALQLP